MFEYDEYLNNINFIKYLKYPMFWATAVKQTRRVGNMLYKILFYVASLIACTLIIQCIFFT